MRKTNKIISTIVALVMLIGTLPTISFAATAVPTDLKWNGGSADITPVSGIEVYLFQVFKDSVMIDQNTYEDELENLEDTDGIGVVFSKTIEKHGSGTYTFRVGVCSDTYEEYTEHWDIDALNVLAWSDYSEEWVYTGSNLSTDDKNTTNATTSKPSSTTNPTGETQPTPTTSATTNTEKVEMDASVISPEYAVAAKTMYHLNIIPNIYRDYNQNVKTDDYREIMKNLSKKNVNGSNKEYVSYSSVIGGIINILGYGQYMATKSTGNPAFVDYLAQANKLGIRPLYINADEPITYEQLSGIIYDALNAKVMVQVDEQGREIGVDVFVIDTAYIQIINKVSDDTLFMKLGYTQADLDEIASRTDTPVYAETETTAPSTTIKLTINNPVATVNGENITNDVAPIIRNSRTMLPVRFIVEALGGQVTWDGATSTVGVISGNINISLVVGADYATVNGEKITLDSSSFVQDGRTYLPLRFISEKLGANVVWDGDTQSVSITK